MNQIFRRTVPALLAAALLMSLAACGEEAPTGSTASQTASEAQSKPLPAPPLQILSVGEPDSRMANFPAGATTEASPIFFTQGADRYMITMTAYSTLTKFLPGKGLDALFTEMQALDYEGQARWITHPQYMGPEGYASATKLNQPQEWEDGATYWKRNYLGISDMQQVTLAGKEYLLCIGHGENKNEKFMDGRKYLNTILPKRAYSDSEFSGPTMKNGQFTYSDNPGTYFAFVTAMLVPADRIGTDDFDAAEYDLGPVIWPSIPYVRKDGSSVNGTVKHPSIFMEGKYLYLYYVEQDYLRVARAEIGDDGKITPFYKLVSDKFDSPALPEGFDKSKRSFLTQATARGDDILSESGTIRFSVAKLEGTPYYIGVQENAAFWPQVKTKLHLSKDLIHWTAGVEIPSMSGMSYTDSYFHYPVFSNEEGTSQKSVRPDAFYLYSIYGSSTGQNRLYRTKLSVSVEE